MQDGPGSCAHVPSLAAGAIGLHAGELDTSLPVVGWGGRGRSGVQCSGWRRLPCGVCETRVGTGGEQGAAVGEELSKVLAGQAQARHRGDTGPGSFWLSPRLRVTGE